MLFAHTLRRVRRSLQTSRSVPRSRKPVRRPFEIEYLETRLAPACTRTTFPPVVWFTCTAASETIKLSMPSSSSLEITVDNVTNTWSLSGLTEVVLIAGDGNDTVDVVSTAAGKALHIHTGNDADIVNVSPVARNLNNLAGNLNIIDSDKQVAIHINDQNNLANSTYTLSTPEATEGRLTRAGAAQISYRVQYSFPTSASVTINGGPGSTTFNVTDTPGLIDTYLNSGTGVNTVNVLRTSNSLFINGQNGLDTVNIGTGGTLQTINGSIHVSNTSSRTALDINDASRTLPRTMTLTDINLTIPSVGLISWVENDLRSLLIKGGFGGNTFNVTDTPSNFAFTGVTLHNGVGTDTVNVSGTTGPLAIKAQSSTDTVNVGNAGSLQAILGAVSLPLAPPLINLNINAEAAPAPQTATLSATGLTGLAAAIQWDVSAVRRLTVNAGSHGNTFTVTGTPNAPDGVLLRSGTGVDTVNVQATSTALTVNGQNGQDTVTLGNGLVGGITRGVHIANTTSRTALVVNDGASIVAKTATLTATGLTGVLPPPATGITWTQADLRSLTLSGGNGFNTYTIDGTPANPGFLGVTLNGGINPDTVRVRATHSPLTVLGGGSADTIQLGSVGNSLNGILVPVTVDGGTGTDTITLNDHANADGRTYGFGAGIFYRGPALVNHSTLETFTLNASPFDDTINVLDNTAGMAVQINGSFGADTLTGTSVTNLFVLNTLGAGVLNQVNSFSSIENLLGQGGADTFRFAAAPAAVSGWIVGGDGTDALDYAALAGDVVVNMTLYTATGVGSFIYQIENATGGAGNDVLVGDLFSNVLDGGLGRDLLIAGGLDWTTYEYSFAPDTLLGGSGEDILIAGWTYFDVDNPSLQWLRDQWAGPGSYTDRVAALSLYLNTDLVYSNWAAGNVLTGGLADLDWFFIRQGADSHDGGVGEDIVSMLY